MTTKKETILIDLKTGKRDHNEIKHAEQIQLYQLYPGLQQVTTELWYLDEEVMPSD